MSEAEAEAQPVTEETGAGRINEAGELQIPNAALEDKLKHEIPDERSRRGEWIMGIVMGISGTALALAITSVVFIKDTSSATAAAMAAGGELAADGSAAIPLGVVLTHGLASLLGFVFVWALALMFPLSSARGNSSASR